MNFSFILHQKSQGDGEKETGSIQAAEWWFGSRPWSSVKDPVTSPEGLQLSTSRCRDTGHHHILLLRAGNHAYVHLCALVLHTHFNLLFYSYLLLRGDDNDCFCFVFYLLFDIANTNCT